MAPAVGWIKPATSRNRLDLPQPDGPTMTENSFSSTSREMRSSAVTGCPIRGVKRRMTLSMRSLPMFGGPRASGVAGPGQQPIPDELEELVGNQAEQADHHDAEEDLVGEQPARGVEDEIAEPLVAGDQLGDHEIGPGPAEGHPERRHDARHGGRDQHTRHHRPPIRAERVGDVEQILGNAARDVGDQNELLEEGADEDDGDLFLDADADPEDEQWDQGRDREIANEIGDRLDRRLDDLEAAHQDAERHRDQRGDDEARHDLGDTRPRVHEERAVPGHVDARLDDGDGGRQEIRAHQPATRLNSSHGYISYAVFCLKKKKKYISRTMNDII